VYHHDKRPVRWRLAIRLPQSGVYLKSINCLDREVPQGNSLSRLEISREAGWGFDEIELDDEEGLGGREWYERAGIARPCR
jgi:hypothetical protein